MSEPSAIGRRLGSVLLLGLAGCGGNSDAHSAGQSDIVGTDAGGCFGPDCCGPQQSLCSGSCVEVAADPNHCGACGRVCAAPAQCVSGACSCPPGTLACNGACVDPRSDAWNCGACGNACGAGAICDGGRCRAEDSTACTERCGGGRTCSGGVCACSVGELACGDRCIDPHTSALHCGACEDACATGQSCTAGTCACPEGQTLCGEACQDTRISAQHCGGCGQACEGAEVCMAGSCRSPAGADGCGDLARGIRISAIDLYQAVQVPIMRDGVAIEAYRRNADVVADRQGMFQIFADPDSDFAPRELSARVTVYNEGGEDTYFAKQRVSSRTSTREPWVTFQVSVPRDRLQTDTSYAVELVECATGQGALRSPRFPDHGEAYLEARETGPMKVVVVPVRANGRLPDLSGAVFEGYRDYLMAMLPVTDIELRVTSEISTGYPIDWAWLLDQIRAKRRDESPDPDVYYYGWVQPTVNFNDFCRGGCTVGIGSVIENAYDASNRTAVGVSFADENSAATMAHELGHNHGRWHAPCGGVSQADRGYPYRAASVGVWGYDARREVFLDPGVATDLMGYCEPKWISDYTFQAMMNRVATLNGPGFAVTDARPVSRWQVILVDRSGVRWGHHFTRPDRPYGREEVAEILDRNGAVMQEVFAYRSEVADGDGGTATVLVPEPEPGWHAVRFRGRHLPVELAFEAP